MPRVRPAGRASAPAALRVRAELRADYQKHKQRRLAYHARRRATPEGSAYARQWYVDNRDRERARNRDWYAAHPEAITAKAARRRAAGPRLRSEQVADRIELYGRRCAYCAGPYDALDHVRPVARGGTNYPANLVPACKRCNSSKHAWTLDEWAARLAADDPRLATGLLARWARRPGRFAHDLPTTGEPGPLV